MAIPQNARHSTDYCSVLWNGVEYAFTPMQAAIVRMLWQALDNGTRDVHASTLLAYADSDLQEARLDPLFFRHQAWKVMIVRGRCRGTYRLNPHVRRIEENTALGITS